MPAPKKVPEPRFPATCNAVGARQITKDPNATIALGHV